MRARFTSAKVNGRYFAIGMHVSELERPEECIFQAMRENPYKSAKAREDFIEGCSSYINQMCARRNRRMNETNIAS